ncbi:MAG TPA: hypothetical protein VLR70_14385, partial [Arthrobacter sp.]|nr:hypothetical protein [Arthrobacter sp.]
GDTMRIALPGAAGRAGVLVLSQTQAHGHRVTTLVRTPGSKAPAMWSRSTATATPGGEKTAGPT